MLKNWLREPLLHYLLIGAALFIAQELRQKYDIVLPNTADKL